MKDSDQTRLATAVNPEALERVLQRDREELEIERQIDTLREISSSREKKDRIDLTKRISRKYYELANSLVEDAQYSEAIDLYSKSISFLRKLNKRKAVDSYFNRAITLAMMGYPKLALDDLKLITDTNHPKADVFFVKGQIFESLGKSKLAERMYKRCLEIDPSFYRASNSLENMHLR